MGGRRSRSHRRRLSASSRNTDWNERSSLLGVQEPHGRRRDYSTVPSTPRPRISRHHSTASPQDTQSRIPSFAQRLTSALSNHDLKNKTTESLLEERVWYDQVGILLCNQ
jgi:chloride channel 3/4/5